MQIAFIPPEKALNIRLICAMVRERSLRLEELSETQRDHAPLMKALMRKNHFAMKYASDRLKDDDDFCADALKLNIELLEFCSHRIRNDRTLALKLYQKYPPIAEFL